MADDTAQGKPEAPVTGHECMYGMCYGSAMVNLTSCSGIEGRDAIDALKNSRDHVMISLNGSAPKCQI